MLDYSLHDNLLTDRTDDMSAQTHPKQSYDRDAFINLMLQRGTLVTKTDIVAVFNNMEETAAYIVENGDTLNLPLLNTSVSISGVFEGATDVFDPARHKLNVNVSKGKVLRDAERRIKVSKISAPAPQPQILEVRDSVSGAVDTVLTSGGAVEVQGSSIKLSGERPETGLYFVAEDGAETKAATIVTNKPSHLIALIPALAAGTYKLKVVTQYNSGKDLKEPKTTVFGKPLTVA
jgi:hypothetical protein